MKLGLRPLTQPRLRSSVFFSRFLFRPKRRLDGAGSFMLQVGHDPGPIHDAALSPRQSLLRFLELALGVAHSTAPDSVELWIRFTNEAKPRTLTVQF